MGPVQVAVVGRVGVITIDRPERRNAVDAATAGELADAVRGIEADPGIAVGVLAGAGGTFCAGADLQAIAAGEEPPDRVQHDGDGPMGPTRMRTTTPFIAAIEGHAVAGGLELALWCDLRVAAEDAVLGVFCRRVGVPLVDGGTVRLPRMIGHGRAMDLILTGRAVAADEALRIGLVDRVVPRGAALSAAIGLGEEIAAHPQAALRADRSSAIAQWDLDAAEALAAETLGGIAALASGEAVAGAQRFTAGERRDGNPAG